MDNRIRRLPKYPGFRHFSGGISKISQWSGKEAKDLERIFLPLLHGVQSPEAITATRAELDFIYHAGWKMLGEEDLKRMVDFNQIFHQNKDSFLQTDEQGGREQDHFRIPKLHARHHYPENIRWLGTPYNYSTEITERYHIEIAKKAHKATNRKDYIKQMLLWLRRQEKIYLRGLFLRWRNDQWNQASNTDIQFDDFLPSVTDNSETQQQGSEDHHEIIQIANELDNLHDGLSILRQTQVIPVVKQTGRTPTAASYTIATRPHLRKQLIGGLMTSYNILNFEVALKTFLIQSSPDPPRSHPALRSALQYFRLSSHWTLLSVWNRFTVTLPTIGFEEDHIEKRSILARLRTKNDFVPRFQPVLVDLQVKDPNPQDGLQGKSLPTNVHKL